MSERMTGPGLSMIVYVSSATQEFDEQRIPDLLATSRENNADLDVTGLLLYEGGNFMQVLEGAADVIEDLYVRIEEDPRHDGCIVLLREPISERKFPDWTMGFRQELPVPAEYANGVSDFFKEQLQKGRTSTDRVDILLDTFRKIINVH